MNAPIPAQKKPVGPAAAKSSTKPAVSPELLAAFNRIDQANKALQMLQGRVQSMNLAAMSPVARIQLDQEFAVAQRTVQEAAQDYNMLIAQSVATSAPRSN